MSRCYKNLHCKRYLIEFSLWRINHNIYYFVCRVTYFHYFESCFADFHRVMIKKKISTKSFNSFKSCQPKSNFNQTLHLTVTKQTHFTDSSYIVRHDIKLQVYLKSANLWSGLKKNHYFRILYHRYKLIYIFYCDKSLTLSYHNGLGRDSSIMC